MWTVERWGGTLDLCTVRFYGGRQMVHGEPRPWRGWRRPRPATGQEGRCRCTSARFGVMRASECHWNGGGCRWVTLPVTCLT